MAAIDLLFSAEPYGQGAIALVFGGTGGAAPAPVVVTHSATFAAPGFSMVVGYDNRVTRWRDQRVSLPHQVADGLRNSTEAGWGLSRKEFGGTTLQWEKAAPQQVRADIPAKQNAKRRMAAALVWQGATAIETIASEITQIGARRRASANALWQLARQVGTDASEITQTGARRRTSLLSLWQVARHAQAEADARMGASRLHRSREADARWQQARVPAQGREVWPPVGPPEIPGYLADLNLLFQCPPLAAPWLLRFGASPCYPEFPDATVIVPIRRIYMVLNSASLRRVDGNLALPVFNMSLGIDADSWTWSFSASLPGNALANLEPSGAGAPVEVEAVINGVAYRALVERIGRERSFGKSDIKVSGRGKTALLDSPYAPSQSFSNSGARTAQQLMGDVLTVNAEPMDWAVNWGLEDWLVPAGVFAQQGSYISALNAIAAAAGGYIQPHASLQSLSVLPRYPVAPWNWSGVTPDFELPSDVTTRENIEWLDKARYNRVFVSGQQAGVLGQVTRDGTAGDLLAPMVTDALITAAAAARQRGLSILSDTGRQANVALRLPVLAETGVITPGKFVRYTDAGVARIGIVRSTAVEVGMPEIWQNLGVQTYA